MNGPWKTDFKSPFEKLARVRRRNRKALQEKFGQMKADTHGWGEQQNELLNKTLPQMEKLVSKMAARQGDFRKREDAIEKSLFGAMKKVVNLRGITWKHPHAWKLRFKIQLGRFKAASLSVYKYVLIVLEVLIFIYLIATLVN